MGSGYSSILADAGDASPLADGKDPVAHVFKYSPVHSNGDTPVLVDQLVVVDCDGADRQFVAALDQAGGNDSLADTTQSET